MKDPKKKNNSSSGIPLAIIGLVFVGVVVGGWWLYSSSKSPATGNENTANRSTSNTARNAINAPAGATPPNMLGSPTASVTLEEFADFQCGSCAAVHPVLKEVQSIYGSKIKFVFRNYPLQMHDKAYDAAVAAEAAGIQGKFWAMQDQLFTNQQAWASPSANHKQLFSEYAQKIGLDVERWQNDVLGMGAKDRVDKDLARGRALNISSTPSLYINNQPVPYPEMNVAGLRRIIDAELQRMSVSQGAQTSPPASNASNTTSNAAPAR